MSLLRWPYTINTYTFEADRRAGDLIAYLCEELAAYECVPDKRNAAQAFTVKTNSVPDTYEIIVVIRHSGNYEITGISLYTKDYQQLCTWLDDLNHRVFVRTARDTYRIILESNYYPEGEHPYPVAKEHR